MPNHETPPPPVRTLRNVFGDTRPSPHISRRITACVECRKQKIRCHMRDSKPPCARCKKKGLSCSVNASLQMLLEGDVVWKDAMEAKMQKLEYFVDDLMKFVRMPDTCSQSRPLGDSQVHNYRMNNATPSDQDQDLDDGEIVMDLESGPSVIPGFHMPRSPTAKLSLEDLIAREVITIEKAQNYFDTYQHRLDHFLYRILGEYSSASLDDVRAASPLLTSAICTVGALHMVSPDFEKCCEDFMSLSASVSFSKKFAIDDVRALIIGAFWLPDLSWTLVGSAVRMATELQLHRSFAKALQGDHSHYLRTRLYLLIYACDHHFSIPYGRPPMTRECDLIRNARLFLQCKHTLEYDQRLVSQVLRWSMLTNIFDTFGSDVDKALSHDEIVKVKYFSEALDGLRNEWIRKFQPNDHIGNYPAKGVDLQYHFAKLYLYSHVFRDVSGPRNLQSGHESLERQRLAKRAIQSALAILQTVQEDREIQSFLNGLSVYFHTMIAFAAVFLLKVTSRFSHIVEFDMAEAKRSLERLVMRLKAVTSSMHPRHILVSIAKGIEDLMRRGDPPAQSPSTRPALEVPEQYIQPDTQTRAEDLDWWMDATFDPNFIGEFDFLGQNLEFPLEMSLGHPPE